MRRLAHLALAGGTRKQHNACLLTDTPFLRAGKLATRTGRASRQRSAEADWQGQYRDSGLASGMTDHGPTAIKHRDAPGKGPATRVGSGS